MVIFHGIANGKGTDKAAFLGFLTFGYHFVVLSMGRGYVFVSFFLGSFLLLILDSLLCELDFFVVGLFLLPFLDFCFFIHDFIELQLVEIFHGVLGIFLVVGA